MCHLLKSLPRDSLIKCIATGAIEVPQVRGTQVSYLRLTINRRKMTRLGVSLATVKTAIKASGADLEKRPVNDKRIETLWKKRGKTIAALRKIVIRNRDGNPIRLSDLVEVEISKTESHIMRKGPPSQKPAKSP